MTRETKIGLLVGLAFIIVIGILLSDHLTTRGELPPAQLTYAGTNVRQGAAVPAPSYPPITPVVAPTGVQPVLPVPTHDEINLAPGRAIVQVTGPQQLPPQPTVLVQPPTDTGAAITAAGLDDAVVITRTPVGEPAVVADPLVALAVNNATPGNTVSPADVDTIMVPVPSSGLAGAPAPLKPSVKEYKAEKGDTVSRMASRMMPGGNTNANRQMIIDANPSLKANPAKVVLGQTYLIPVGTRDDAAVTAGASVELTGTATATAGVTETKPAKASAPTYTAREKDTLWKIAADQLGNGTLWKEIRDLNKDLLKGGDVVKPGMTLKLPAKTSVASR